MEQIRVSQMDDVSIVFKLVLFQEYLRNYKKNPRTLKICLKLLFLEKASISQEKYKYHTYLVINNLDPWSKPTYYEIELSYPQQWPG